MWKKLKTVFAKLFGCSNKSSTEPVIQTTPQEEHQTVVEEISTEPMIKQLKKKRQKKS